MGTSYRAVRSWLRLILAAATCCLCACGSQADRTLTDAGIQGGVPWPPQAVRHISDYDLTLFGNEWIMKSAAVDSYGYSLKLSGGAGLPWVVYAISGVDEANELAAVNVEFTESPEEPGDGTQLFIGLADYDRGAWVWFNPAPSSPWLHSYSEPQHFRDGSGAAYVAVALAGPGKATVETLNFSILSGAVEIPQNLTAHSPVVGRIELSWDMLASADGYNVYRSTVPDMSSKLQLNADPLAANSYIDEPVTTGCYHFYQVTAVTGTESGPSNTAAVWAHEVELAAPQNFQLTARGEDSITFGWEWSDPDPDNGFYLYVDTQPGFAIVEAVTERRTIGRWADSAEIGTYQGLPLDSGTYYYAKLCARDSLNYRGRMSAEAFGRIGTGWDWSDVETIDTGNLPLRAVKTGTGIAVAYFSGFSINLAVSDGGPWSIDTPLPDSGELLFTNWMDLAYSDGLYLIGAMDKGAGDVWAAYGVPGAWTRDHLHGDGNNDPVPLHVESGFYVVCAASKDQLAVLHLFDQPPPDIPAITLHTKEVFGGAWQESTVRTFDMDEIAYPLVLTHCLEYYNHDLYYLCNDGGEAELYFTHREDDWSFVGKNISGAGNIFRTGLDLVRFNNDWYTTAFDNLLEQRGLFLLKGETFLYPWEQERLTPVAQQIGYNARLDADGDEAIVAYYGGGSYHTATYSTGWTAEQIAVPGVTDYGDQVEILLQDGEGYFVFQDGDTGEIKVAHGVPPES